MALILQNLILTVQTSILKLIEKMTLEKKRQYKGTFSHILFNHTSEIFNFIRNFKAVKADRNYINVTACTDFIEELSEKFDLPLTNYFIKLKRLLPYRNSLTIFMN
ncbi:MAG TPA: hypothetical protein GX727_07480 [Clostridium sp.]|jgi:hypothetical protein|nr:hypothetical protein [Clostridium sp.]